MAKAAQTALPPRECRQCPKSFTPRRNTQFFCSRKCRNAFNNKRSYIPSDKRSNLGALGAIVTKDIEFVAEARRISKIIRERAKVEDPKAWSVDMRRLVMAMCDLIDGK